jgi:hypothetical protein
MDDEGYVSLANLKGGAVIEAADNALEEVYQNILDPNTEATQTREVSVKLIFKPGKDRSTNQLVIKVDRKLAAQAPMEAAIFIGKVKDTTSGKEKAVGAEYGPLNPGQHVLPDTVEDRTSGISSARNVTPFKSAAGGSSH